MVQGALSEETGLGSGQAGEQAWRGDLLEALQTVVHLQSFS